MNIKNHNLIMLAICFILAVIISDINVSKDDIPEIITSGIANLCNFIMI